MPVDLGERAVRQAAQNSSCASEPRAPRTIAATASSERAASPIETVPGSETNSVSNSSSFACSGGRVAATTISGSPSSRRAR